METIDDKGVTDSPAPATIFRGRQIRPRQGQQLLRLPRPQLIGAGKPRGNIARFTSLQSGLHEQEREQEERWQYGGIKLEGRKRSGAPLGTYISTDIHLGLWTTHTTPEQFQTRSWVRPKKSRPLATLVGSASHLPRPR